MDGIIATLRAHEFLNVRFDATPEEVKKAYILLMRRYHPDKNPRYGDRANWICKMLGDAMELANRRSVERRYPVLEHYTPVLDDGPRLCVCGFVKEDNADICNNCGRIYLPTDKTKENKDKVWAVCLAFTKQLKANYGDRFDDWEAAGRLFRRHFDS